MKNNKRLWLNFFVAGEGYHKNHHDNQRRIRLHKWDTGGWIAEKLFKDYGKEKHKLKQIIRGERFVNVPKIKEVSDVLQQQVVADTLYVRGSGQVKRIRRSNYTS